MQISFFNYRCTHIPIGPTNVSNLDKILNYNLVPYLKKYVPIGKLRRLHGEKLVRRPRVNIQYYRKIVNTYNQQDK